MRENANKFDKDIYVPNRKENDMSGLDRIEVKINAKIDVPTETAEACVRLLEIWVNADNSRRIEIDSVTTEEGVEQKIYLVEGE